MPPNVFARASGRRSRARKADVGPFFRWLAACGAVAGVLWADGNGFNAAVPQESTQMPLNPSTLPTYPYITYYFRTHFTFTNSLAGVTLIFSNYIDDGAVFYLNGAEIYRQNMPAGPVDYLSSASSPGFWLNA